MTSKPQSPSRTNPVWNTARQSRFERPSLWPRQIRTSEEDEVWMLREVTGRRKKKQLALQSTWLAVLWLMSSLKSLWSTHFIWGGGLAHWTWGAALTVQKKWRFGRFSVIYLQKKGFFSLTFIKVWCKFRSVFCLIWSAKVYYQHGCSVIQWKNVLLKSNMFEQNVMCSI